MMEYIYSPENYYMRIMTFLRAYKPPNIKKHGQPVRIMGYFRSLVRLGIMGRERLYYWKLVLWAAIRRRELFGLAVTLAIHG